MKTKTCYTCGIEKPETEFKRVGVNASRMRNCKECYVARRRANKEKGVKYDQREYFMEDVYGITTQQYSEILDSQGGGCAICEALPPTDTRKKFLVVDHDHETGKVRGLLCDTCNRGLGLLGDNIVHLCAAVDYLNRNG